MVPRNEPYFPRDRSIKMETITLNPNHSCNCGACIEIPKLFIVEKAMSELRDHHTCECDACISNLNSIVDTKSITNLKEDHTCQCDACTEDQKKLAGLA